MAVLVTGVAGFIGFHTAQALLARGERVIGVDNLNEYYDPALKKARLAQITHPKFTFYEGDVADRVAMMRFAGPDVLHIVHLAAQAGVRHSMVDPYSYVTSNLMGQVVMLELARALPNLKHFVYASSSSVYGLNRELPFSESDPVNQPSSLYAATKRGGELVSHSYAHLFGIAQTGLRFFTVYGPWGRPDMAYYSFAKAIVAGEPITLYDGGRLKRDFTYIDDIVAGILGAIYHPPKAGEGLPNRVLNIGNHRAEEVVTLVRLLEAGLGRKAVIVDETRPAADVVETWANIDALQELTGFSPVTGLEEGVGRFVTWFRKFHHC